MRWIAPLSVLALALVVVWMSVSRSTRDDARAVEHPAPAPIVERELAPAELAAIVEDEREPRVLQVAEAAPTPSTEHGPLWNENDDESLTKAALASKRVDFSVYVVCPTDEECRNARVYCEACNVRKDGVHPGWGALQRQVDETGHADFAVRELQTRCVAVRAVAEPHWVSTTRVFTGSDRMPRALTLTLERAHSLHVVVQDESGRELEHARVVVATTGSATRIVLDERDAGMRGDADFELPDGHYELTASLDDEHEDAREAVALFEDQTVTLVLREKEKPLAVTGVVVDESGVGIANVAVRASWTRERTDGGSIEQTFVLGTLVDSRSATTGRFESTVHANARGEFEIRAPRCKELELQVAGGPLFARLEPSPPRVAHGTLGIVVRRKHAWATSPVRVHCVDATSKVDVRGARFSMCVRGDETSRSTTTCHSGLTDVSVPIRDDATWRVEAPGYASIEGSLDDLRSRLRDGVLELALVRTSSVRTSVDASMAPRAR